MYEIIGFCIVKKNCSLVYDKKNNNWAKFYDDRMCYQALVDAELELTNLGSKLGKAKIYSIIKSQCESSSPTKQLMYARKILSDQTLLTIKSDNREGFIRLKVH